MTGLTQRVVTDEGRRASDVVNTALLAEPDSVGRWIALRLRDGGSDGAVYDTRPDAIRHQLTGARIFYVRIPPDGISPQDASRLLLVGRLFDDAGYRLVDPDDKTEPITPWTNEDLAALIKAAGRGKNV